VNRIAGASIGQGDPVGDLIPCQGEANPSEEYLPMGPDITGLAELVGSKSPCCMRGRPNGTKRGNRQRKRGKGTATVGAGLLRN